MTEIREIREIREITDAPLIVMCAPNGARQTKDEHGSLPLAPDELADCAEDLLACGVSVLHLHVRDETGRHSLNADHYRAAMAAIRDRVGNGLVLQVTTEAVGRYDRHQQMKLVRDLKPEAVSLALRELCPDDSTIEEAGSFFREITEDGIWPQYILYAPDEVARFDRLRTTGVFGAERPFAMFVLGRYNEALTGDPAELDLFLAEMEPDAFPWSVCCFGAREAEAAALAATRGGHIRVGFENNSLLPNGSIATDNTALVEAALRCQVDRPIADANWVRQNFMGR